MAGTFEQMGAGDQTPDDFDDAISVTSTVEGSHDPDEEYEVEGIRDEVVDENGATYFLVEWTGFNLDQCTWEPETNLGPDIRQMMWETKKATMSPEERARERQEVEDAQQRVLQEKLERHKRRNAARKRRGLPLTEPFEEEEVLPPPTVVDVDSGKESSDEAMEDNAMPSEPSQSLASTPKVSGKQRIFKGIPPPTETPVTKTVPRRSSDMTTTAGMTPKKPVVKKTSQNSLSRSSLASTVDDRSSQRNEPKSVTGYQGTARKTAPGSTGSTSATKLTGPPNTARATLAVKFSTKPLKAKKSGQVANHGLDPGITNVFAGGKTRKPRKTLGETMVDSTKRTKLFDKHSTKRKAELYSRNKADEAPDISILQGHLFPLSRGPQEKESLLRSLARSSSLENGSRQEPRQTSTTEKAEPSSAGEALTRAKSVMAGSALSSNTDEGERPNKVRKSVRFLDDDSPMFLEPTEMRNLNSLDSPVLELHTENTAQGHSGEDQTTSTLTPGRAPTPPPPGALRKLSLVDYHSRQTQSIGKVVVFGDEGSSTLKVTFSSVPRDDALPGLSEFLAQETLIFRTVCFVRTFLEQLDHFREGNICSGSITSQGYTVDLLERVAQRLRTTLSGLYCSHSQFSLILYPTKCEEWTTDVLGTEPSSPEGTALRYVLFRPKFDFDPFLRPATLSSTTLEPGYDRATFMQVFFNLDYQKLCSNASSPVAQHFFLAFPSSKAEILKSVCLWLRTCNPECQVYASFQVGGWSAFVERTRLEAGHAGAVIVHESLTWTVRRFPGLSELLQGPKNNYNFWSFSDATQLQPIHPSISPASWVTSPGDVNLIRLFPHGNAILLTPSFMVSEPQRTFDFFHWFFKYRAQTSAFKLVLARDVREFIRSVAEEKTARRASLLQDRQYSIVEQNLQANLRAVTETDCRAVWQTFHMLWLNLDLREERNGPYAALEENGPIIYADACIDANDEQSLVNWFGWWSMLRADQYRKFYVVGSSIKMTALRAMRGVRTLDIPNYSHTSINNPDTLLEKLEYHEPAQEATTVLQQTDHGAPQLQRPWRFESERFEENSRTWAEWLGGLDHPAPWRLYQYPVSWPSFEQADHFGDTRGEFKRFEDWFSWARPFLKDDLRRFNSYVGFFYTIPGEWDPSLYPQSKRPKRHAWIGIYRPVNCYWKKEPYKKCEVIIWDVSASDKLQNKDVISEADLTPMQRELIRFLRKAGSKKNPGTYIHQVWLGGPKHPPTQSQFPFDLTAMFLEDMMGDIRTYLPAPEHAMPARGYRKLGPDGSSEPMLATAKTNGHQIEMSSNTSEPMDIDPTLDGISEEPTDAKIIFHPPRGTKLASREPTLTKCHNYLYESVRLARLRDKTTQTIEYVYKPTLEWYADQKAEGRSFEHITIDTWETIFSVLKIGSAEPSKDQERKASVDSSINSIDGKVNEE